MLNLRISITKFYNTHYPNPKSVFLQLQSESIRMRTLWSFIILLLLSGQGRNLFAQWHCGTPLPTNQEKKQLLAQYQNFIQQKNSGKFRINNYKVALKVNIISGTNTPE